MKNILTCRIGLRTRYIVAMTVACAAVHQLSASTNEGDSIRNRFLLLDSRIIDSVEDAQLVPGTVLKHKSNPLFTEDKPWEKRFDNLYGNVIYDEEESIYKCWYSPFIKDESAAGMTLAQRKAKKYRSPKYREMAICYATSTDGLRWEKPEMDLVDFEGSKANNILWRGRQERESLWKGPHGSGIFKDLLDPDPGRRYKAILKAEILSVAFSPDGLLWGAATACPEADVAGDTHNNAFWAPTLNKYVGITREWGRDPDAPDGQPKKWRQVARIESEDFINWTKAEVVLEGMDTNLQTYAMPTFFYGGVYLGLVAVHDQESDRVWTELSWSPDTWDWHRISPGVPLISNSETPLDYDYGCVYACANPVFLDNEIRLYYGGSDYHHYGWRTGNLSLATLRPDGFAGYEQESKDKPAIITTALIPYAGQKIRITADVEKGGSIKVSIVDNIGQDTVTAGTVSKTVTDGRLKWKKKINTNGIRLKFEINNAKLYSFSFAEYNLSNNGVQATDKPRLTPDVY